MKMHFTKRRWLLTLIPCVVLGGCSGPSQHQAPEQVVSHIQAEMGKNKRQEKFLAQMGQSTLTAYKDYAVGPEDLLEISFFGLPDLDRVVRVSGRGEITLPLVGLVAVEGSSPQDIEQRLSKAYKEGDYINNPQIMVHVKEYRHQRVMVSGAVDRPGSYEMIGPRTLLEMVGAAGGLKEQAGNIVYIIRSQRAPTRHKTLAVAPAQPFSPGSETVVVDLDRLLTKGAYDLNLSIKNGDVIYVPFAKMAYVFGAVRKAGNVPIKVNMTVTQAVAMAGGQDQMLASNNLTIVRFDADGKTMRIPLNIGQVIAGSQADIPLQENDIVFVQESMVRRFLYDFKNLMPGSFGAAIPLVP